MSAMMPTCVVNFTIESSPLITCIGCRVWQERQPDCQGSMSEPLSVRSSVVNVTIESSPVIIWAHTPPSVRGGQTQAQRRDPPVIAWNAGLKPSVRWG